MVRTGVIIQMKYKQKGITDWEHFEDMPFDLFKKPKKVLTNLKSQRNIKNVNQKRKDNVMATPISTNKNTKSNDDGGLLAMAILVHTILISVAGIFLATHAHGKAVIPAIMAGILLLGEAIGIVVYHFTKAHQR